MTHKPPSPPGFDLDLGGVALSRFARQYFSKEENRRDWLRRFWEVSASEARTDVNVFAKLCFRNDQSAAYEKFEQQWFHREWQSAWESKQTSVIHGGTGLGKTEQMVARILWKTGRAGTRRTLVLGKQQQNASQTLRKVKTTIESNEMVRAVFPGLRPGPVWSGERLRVAEAGTDNTTDTVLALGAGGSPQGIREDEIFADDVLDFENTLTEASRDRMLAFCDSVIQSRLTTTGQFHMVVNAWHPKDAAFVMSTRAGVWHGVYPARGPGKFLTRKQSGPGELIWPSFRSDEWLDLKLGTMSPNSFARMFLCQPRDEETRIFKTAMLVAARRVQPGTKPIFATNAPPSNAMDIHTLLAPPKMRIIVGVDLASGETQRKRKTDLTVFFIVGVHPSGRRQVLWIEKGRWSIDESLIKMREIEARYQPDLWMVESNGMQRALIRHMEGHAGVVGEIRATHTGAEKWSEDMGVEMLTVQLRAKQWIVPAPQIGEDELIERTLYIDGLDANEREAYDAICLWSDHVLDFQRGPHTPDDVMAWYFAEKGVQQFSSPWISTRNLDPNPEQIAMGLVEPGGSFDEMVRESGDTATPDGLGSLLARLIKAK